MNKTIERSYFVNMNIGVRAITKASDFPEARSPSYQIQIFFGPEIGFKKSSAQPIHRYYNGRPAAMQLVAILNFPPKQIANFMGECLILGSVDKKDVLLLQPEATVTNKLKIA